MKWAQSMDDIYKFNPLCRRSALCYHVVFHYSIEIQINHLIFLHTYILGLFMVACCGGFIAVLGVMFPLVIYSLIVIRPLVCFIMYVTWLCGLAILGYILDDILRDVFLLNSWQLLLSGVGVVLISFACQLLGHYYHEEYAAPPNLIHGFIAAPILEYQLLLMRVGLADQNMLASIVVEATSQRSRLSQKMSTVVDR
mmetsp:Transcript_9626/g.14489  ORF Transcript_9626/g.14489 Transcript_9626/m.14489 type:complete len:197 (+) Transcript_9626:3-593(+)